MATTIDVGGAFILAPYAAGSRAGFGAVVKAFGNGINALVTGRRKFEEISTRT